MKHQTVVIIYCIIILTVEVIVIVTSDKTQHQVSFALSVSNVVATNIGPGDV